ncbi:MAG: permease [Candidatus Adiutrix sp.]|jgi:putative hydroxymethylpyrimidine transporter CytX|nr:permease [Candidatus Adiutrix sp.]
MNAPIRKSAMTLLWLGAAISISEIAVGGLIAPLGLAQGAAAIVGGHLIGGGLLALGGYISYQRRTEAMDTVTWTLGGHGAALAALCNVVQLVGWTVIMIVQAGSALKGVMPEISFGLTAAILSALVLIWALIFRSPAGRLNDLMVVLLAGLCLTLFLEALGLDKTVADAASGSMSLTLAIELSIAMPVSWLPLIGDYTCRAGDKYTAAALPFLGYSLGSIAMYLLGLFIGVTSGKDIFAFIADSQYRLPACGVVALSTLTTAFLDLYSAAVSSQLIVKSRNVRTPILIIGLLSASIAVFFPVDSYSRILESFLINIGLVFVPIYTVLFLEFLIKKPECGRLYNWPNLFTVAAGMAAYYLFVSFEIWIPTLATILLVIGLYGLLTLRQARRPALTGGPAR